jgi:hypothetical protein
MTHWQWELCITERALVCNRVDEQGRPAPDRASPGQHQCQVSTVHSLEWLRRLRNDKQVGHWITQEAVQPRNGRIVLWRQY